MADKGFASQARETSWRAASGSVVAATSIKTAKRAWDEAANRWAAGTRQVIEQVIHHLTDLFALERHRAKTLGGVLTRLAATIVASTAGQLLDQHHGRPLRHLADLLVYWLMHQPSKRTGQL